MNENNKVLFIINKYAGSGYQASLEGKILARCEELQLEPTLEFTQGKNHGTDLARNAAHSKKYKVVFAVGGDGTVNEVAQGVFMTGQTMGILPKGSGNGLARHLGIPGDFKKSLTLIGSSHCVEIDSFLINEKISVNISGIGFDGHVATLFGKNGKRGLMGYSQLVMKEFFGYKEFVSEGLIDNKPHKKDAFILAFANSSQFGNNAKIAPHASVCDGLIDVCFIRKVPFIQTPSFAHKLFTGHIEKSSFIDIIKARNVSLTFARSMPYHVDGEAMNATREFNIQVKPASISMLLPESLHTEV
jgi:YegS/Rv2252/BmrU family lipid kinase